MNDLSTSIENDFKHVYKTKRVLIVDDDFDFAESLEEILETRSYKVAIAQNKSNAVELALRTKPHIAFLDVRLGSENGIELVEDLLGINRSLVCMILTGYGSIATAIEAIKIGATDYLTKPIFPEDLLLKTEKAFQKLELERRHAVVERMSRQTELWHRTIVDAAGEAIVSTDMQGKIKSLNQVARKLIQGESRSFPYIQDVVGNLDWKHLTSINEVMSQQEYSLLRASGHSIPVNITVSRGVIGDKERMIFILRDISDQKQAENKIRLANELLERRVANRTRELEEANEELRAFSYSVSHDLRAPLRAINGFSAALLEDEAENLSANGRADLERVIDAATKMGCLIDDLLRLAKLNKDMLNVQLVSLSEIVENSLLHLEKSEPHRSVEYVIEEKVFAMADPGLIQVVMENLVSNAWKFTRYQPRPRIEFGAINNSSESIYFLRDNGIGFDMRFVEKIFQTFSRLHNGQDYEGSGIGLATTKRIIGRHNGKVWVDAAPNSGACFYFTLG